MKSNIGFNKSLHSNSFCFCTVSWVVQSKTRRVRQHRGHCEALCLDVCDNRCGQNILEKSQSHLTVRINLMQPDLLQDIMQTLVWYVSIMVYKMVQVCSSVSNCPFVSLREILVGWWFEKEMARLPVRVQKT